MNPFLAGKPARTDRRGSHEIRPPATFAAVIRNIGSTSTPAVETPKRGPAHGSRPGRRSRQPLSRRRPVPGAWRWSVRLTSGKARVLEQILYSHRVWRYSVFSRSGVAMSNVSQAARSASGRFERSFPRGRGCRALARRAVPLRPDSRAACGGPGGPRAWA